MSATEHQRRVTALLLQSIGPAGFALAGSGAIREHGITNRPTQDVDLFATSTTSPDAFNQGLKHAEQALGDAGLSFTRTRTAPLFARLVVSGATDEMVVVDLAVDWRMQPPVSLEVGPVLALPDAVGSKVAAVFSRAEARDFLDLDAIRESGLYSDDALLSLAHEHDPGFDPGVFARQLACVAQLDVRDTIAYRVDGAALEQIQQRLRSWANELGNA
ncbi:nucleotidyl transferase AbiEii/AbiGii toxin family protein [Mycobacterium sp.]|uniref:nucleotidyl transferase AbiEii/AbiGii toxin family protein n=1 Tax=Mycobacterium sp. TaxID=1785 RepID=UPI003D6A7AA5